MSVSKEKVKMVGFIVAGVLVVLSAVGMPTKQKKLSKRSEVLISQAVIKRCVPGTQLDLPTVPQRLSFLCFLDLKSGYLDHLGMVGIPNPIPESGVAINSPNP